MGEGERSRTRGEYARSAVKEWLERMGGEGLALMELRPFRSWTFLAMSILNLIIFWRSARAEWLEWREGWLQRSGASPLQSAVSGYATPCQVM